MVSHPLGAKPQESNVCFGGASFAGGHSQEELLHAPPQHCVLSNLPQASVQLFHLLILTSDIYRGAESIASSQRPFQKCPQKTSPPGIVL